VVNRYWRAATLVWMAGILVVSLLPGPAGAPSGTFWHLVGYGVLGALWGQWQVAWIVWLLAAGYGAAIEGLQWLLPYRLAEAADLLTNALGALAGLLITRAWAKLHQGR
jgi:ABC-type Co2+ transport system permease subunit